MSMQRVMGAGNVAADPGGAGQDGPVPVVPPKLRRGSMVLVIAPSRSLAIIGPEVRGEADRKLAALGLRVSFGEHRGMPSTRRTIVSAAPAASSLSWS